MLIVTLPNLSDLEMTEKILKDPRVEAVRYNTGNISPYESEYETLSAVISPCKKYDKKVYIDIEGRQIRVAKWSYPKYGGQVLLNRELELDLPAKIFFRGDRWYEISFVNKDKVFLSKMPKRAIGEGQTINISSPNWKVNGPYLSESDLYNIDAAVKLGVRNFCLSFIESWSDVDEVEKVIANTLSISDISEFELVLKIESLKGLRFVENFKSELIQRTRDENKRVFKYRLMAARDDLLTNLMNDSLKLMAATEHMIFQDEGAILASRIFSGLASLGYVTTGDIADIFNSRMLGFQCFMLSDTISVDYFDEAMSEWSKIMNILENKEENDNWLTYVLS